DTIPDLPTGDATAPGDTAFMGTPRYIAPERIGYAVRHRPDVAPEMQLRLGKVTGPIDGRVDLYATGLIMPELLPATFPFPPPSGAVSRAEMSFYWYDQHVNGTPRPLPPEVPPELRDIVGRLLAKEPGGRFPDAAHLIRAIADWQRSMSLPVDVARP